MTMTRRFSMDYMARVLQAPWQALAPRAWRAVNGLR